MEQGLKLSEGSGWVRIEVAVYVSEHYVGFISTPTSQEVAHRPSPEEFFATITVELATNLDATAVSKGQPEQPGAYRATVTGAAWGLSSYCDQTSLGPIELLLLE